MNEIFKWEKSKQSANSTHRNQFLNAELLLTIIRCLLGKWDIAAQAESKLGLLARKTSDLLDSFGQMESLLDHGYRSGQVWGQATEQRVDPSTFRRYTFGLRLAIAQADNAPTMPISQT